MSTPPNVTRRRKDTLHQEYDAPEEVETINTPMNTDVDVNWGTEPNFNLSLLSNPRSTKGTFTMHSGHKNEDRSKGGGNPGCRGAVTTDFNTISLPGERLKSKIPTISSSPTVQTTMKSQGNQPLKSPNIKHHPNPKIQMHSSSAVIPKPNDAELNSSQGSTEKVKTEIPKTESAKPLTAPTPNPATKSANTVASNLEMQSDKRDEGEKGIHYEASLETLQLPKNPNVHYQKGSISPQLTNRTPKMMTKIRKTHLGTSTNASNLKSEDDSRSQGVVITLEGSQKNKMESALITTKPSKVNSPSPKPSTQKKISGPGNGTASGSKGNRQGKDLKTASGAKIGVKSSSSYEATKGSKDSLDSKASSKSRSLTGSRDALDSRSSSASKSSLDSRNGLDSKKLQSSKDAMASREQRDPKTTTESRMKKSHQSPEASAECKMVQGSKNNPGFKLLQNSKASFDSKSKTASCSDSKPDFNQAASQSTLQASAFNTDLLGSFSLSSISSGSIKTAGSAAELSLISKSQSNLSRSGQVLSDAKSTLIDLSSSLRLSPISASQSPGSSAGKSLASTLTGSDRENQKSPSSSPGTLAPLASSSPKTKPAVTSKALEGSTHTSEPSTVMKRDPSGLSQNTRLTRGLTFHLITKAGENADNEQLKPIENKVNTKEGLGVSQESKDGCPPGDKRKKPILVLSKAGQQGDTNILSTPRATSARDPKQKLQVHGNKNSEKSSPRHNPILASSIPTSTKKQVRDSLTKTELTQRPHKRPGDHKEVGVQVEVEVVERSASTSPSLLWGPPTSSLIGFPSYQTSLSCIPSLKHVCQIEIELCSQSPLPSVAHDKASSLPACLRSYSFQQNPTLMLEVGQNHNSDVSAESIWEDESGNEEQQPNKTEEDGFKGETEKPPEVLWDKRGMTWEVYGASVDLESLGTAIQSHLEMKIQEQERHIRILRKSICSNSSFKRYKLKKRRRRFLGCCVKASAVAD